MPGVKAKEALWVNTMIRRVPQRAWWSSFVISGDVTSTLHRQTPIKIKTLLAVEK